MHVSSYLTAWTLKSFAIIKCMLSFPTKTPVTLCCVIFWIIPYQTHWVSSKSFLHIPHTWTLTLDLKTTKNNIVIILSLNLNHLLQRLFFPFALHNFVVRAPLTQFWCCTKWKGIGSHPCDYFLCLIPRGEHSYVSATIGEFSQETPGITVCSCLSVLVAQILVPSCTWILADKDFSTLPYFAITNLQLPSVWKERAICILGQNSRGFRQPSCRL